MCVYIQPMIIQVCSVLISNFAEVFNLLSSLTGEVTAVFCKLNCNNLGPYLILNLICKLTVSVMMMPAFVFDIR